MTRATFKRQEIIVVCKWPMIIVPTMMRTPMVMQDCPGVLERLGLAYLRQHTHRGLGRFKFAHATESLS